MLELAHKLADCDTHTFDGWVLAGAEVHIHGCASRLTNSVLSKKARRCVLTVLGTDTAGNAVKILTVFLVLPKSIAPATQGVEPPDGKPIACHSFTAAEVATYVDYTGDLNIIHSGEHPIVPGLCLCAYVQQALGCERLDWRVSFLAPVYADDELRVYQSADKTLQGYIGSTRVFSIKY